MNNEISTTLNNSVMNYNFSDDINSDIDRIIETSQKGAYQAANMILTQRNWFIGYRIHIEVMKEQDRADYGTGLIKKLSADLTKKHGKGYDRSNLYNYLRFYRMFPKIVDIECRQSFIQLSWSHYRALLYVEDSVAREWYAKEAFEQTWSFKTLQRNINTQYYYRLLKSQDKESVEKEMQEKTSSFQNDKLEYIKNPIIAEFLGMEQNVNYHESELEDCIISNLQSFIMELGKGYAFVARQQHIKTEKEDYFIDLVFYNYILKCFVLIDLKTDKITHQDVGQMDMYIRMYDELKKSEDDNPTLGIVLCTETDEDIARYSVMHGNEQLFASKYKLYLPSEEELKQEIETQKTFYYLQKNNNAD